MAVAMGTLIILALFQIHLYMAPCEQCVYIRYAMFVMVIGGLVAAINPGTSSSSHWLRDAFTAAFWD